MIALTGLPLLLVTLLAGQATARDPTPADALPSDTPAFTSPAQEPVPPLASALGKGVPYVSFVIPSSVGADEYARVIENTWCVEIYKPGSLGVTGRWNHRLAWNTMFGNDAWSEAWNRYCQIFIIQPYMWRENWFWVQVSDPTVYSSWSQKKIAVTDANPLWELDQQFSIECKKVLPDDETWYAHDCQIVFLAKSRDVDGCLFAKNVVDVGSSGKDKGGLRAGPCNKDVDGNDSSRFHLLRAGLSMGQ